MNFTATEIERFRDETPGTQNRCHLNNAGDSMSPLVVTDTIQNYIQEESMLGGYELMQVKAEASERFYTSVAELLNTQPHHIAYTTSATDAYAKALSSIPFEKGDIILTTDDDYVSNQLAFLSIQQRQGIQLLHCPTLPEGGLDIGQMETLIKSKRPKLVAVTQIPTNSGLVQDVAAVGAICRAENVLYLVDACQGVGQRVVDVEEIACDFLAATGRKFLRGPRGTGFLYVSERVLKQQIKPLFFDLRGANWLKKDEFKLMPSARRFEYWERSYALMLGLTAAVQYANAIDMQRIQHRVENLAAYARTQLATLPACRILDKGKELCGIVSLHLAGVNPQALTQNLFEQGINLGAARRENALIDFDKKAIDWSLRISPHYYNTKAEIDQCVKAIASYIR